MSKKNSPDRTLDEIMEEYYQVIDEDVLVQKKEITYLKAIYEYLTPKESQNKYVYRDFINTNLDYYLELVQGKAYLMGGLAKDKRIYFTGDHYMSRRMALAQSTKDLLIKYWEVD